ncbi:cellulose binding domain-containing protein [Streptomyces subrutilus]|uniref:cellulose binding domain-containing protein n=1 Tax=Streptomyces subrutilus TaxID=36818 RepID=UPI00341BDBB1
MSSHRRNVRTARATAISATTRPSETSSNRWPSPRENSIGAPFTATCCRTADRGHPTISAARHRAAPDESVGEAPSRRCRRPARWRPYRASGGAQSGCTAAFVVTDSWTGAFDAEIKVKNTGGAATRSRKVTWTWPGSREVTHFWDAQLTQTGPAVTATGRHGDRQRRQRRHRPGRRQGPRVHGLR